MILEVYHSFDAKRTIKGTKYSTKCSDGIEIIIFSIEATAASLTDVSSTAARISRGERREYRHSIPPT